MTIAAVRRSGQSAVAAVLGSAVVAFLLLVIGATALHPSSSPTVRYSQVAFIPTLAVSAVLLLLAGRRDRPAAAWLLAGLAVLVVLSVLVGAGVYEEWLETQPGGRGYRP